MNIIFRAQERERTECELPLDDLKACVRGEAPFAERHINP